MNIAFALSGTLLLIVIAFQFTVESNGPTIDNGTVKPALQTIPLNLKNKPKTTKLLLGLEKGKYKPNSKLLDNSEISNYKDLVTNLAYTIWCSVPSHDSIDMYIATKSIIDYSIKTKQPISDVLHKPGRFECWGADGKTITTPVDSAYLAFYQALEFAIMLTMDTNE